MASTPPEQGDWIVVARQAGSIMAIDPATGDRRLVVGRAFDDNGPADTAVARCPTNSEPVFIDDASGIVPIGNFDIRLVNVFGDRQVVRDSLTTGRLDIVPEVDVSPQDLFLTDLLIYRRPPCTANVHGDGMPNFFDVPTYLNAYSRGCD